MPVGAVQREPNSETNAGGPLWREVVDAYARFVREMTVVNGDYPTVTRSRWQNELTTFWSYVGGPGERTDEELRLLQRALVELQNLFVDENTAAYDLWYHLLDVWAAERTDLLSSPLREDEAASRVLEAMGKRSEERVEQCGAYLVQEDLVEFHYMLDKGLHLTRGEKIAEREWKRERKLEERFREEPDETEPGAVGVVWDIVGWETKGEFAADVALTVLTGGLGKIAKVVVKGGKAARRLRRLRKLAKARKLRKAKRLQKLSKGVTKLLGAVARAVESFPGIDYASWAKKEWTKIGRAYLTDELGVHFGGGDATTQKTLLERLSKEAVAAYVSGVLRITSDAEKKQFLSAVAAFAVGYNTLGMSGLRRYLIMNFKRRLLTNVVYYGLRVGALETKLSPKVITNAAIATSAEMAQDLVLQVPGAPQLAVETARKTVQTAVSEWVAKGLT